MDGTNFAWLKDTDVTWLNQRAPAPPPTGLAQVRREIIATLLVAVVAIGTILALDAVHLGHVVSDPAAWIWE